MEAAVMYAPRPAEASRPPRGSRKVAKPHFLDRGSAIAILLLTLIAALLPCAASSRGPALNPAQARAPSLSGIAVLDRGFEAGGEFCSDFKLTPSQIQWFFRRARIMDADKLFDRFNELPCWIRGKAKVRGSAWRWEIRAGGTASLTQPDGSVQLLGCGSCDAVLGGSAMRRQP